MKRIKPGVISYMKELRTSGHSVPEISRITQTAKSSVLRHIKDTPIAREHMRRWLDRKRTAQILCMKRWDDASIRASTMVKDLTDRELYLIGASLYWAGGSKKDFSFANTDGDLVKIFISSLMKTYGVKSDDIFVSIRVYDDLIISDCLKYWSKITGKKLGRETKINVLTGKKHGKLKYGMCRIRVRNGGNLLKLFHSLKEQIAGTCPRSSMDRTRDS